MIREVNRSAVNVEIVMHFINVNCNNQSSTCSACTKERERGEAGAPLQFLVMGSKY